MVSPATAVPQGRTGSTTPSADPSARQRGSVNGLPYRNKSQHEAKAHDQKQQSDQKLPSTHVADNSPDKHSHDRLLFLYANAVGSEAKVVVKSGDCFSGIFSAFNVDSQQYVFKMVKKIQSASKQSNGSASSDDEYIGYDDDHVMIFNLKDTVNVQFPKSVIDKAMVKTNGVTTGFRTDSDISGNASVRHRELLAWQPSPGDIIEPSMSTNGKPEWDQFETNERLYGVKTDYDETFYTTAIDRSHPKYKERAAKADKLAREIEGTAATNEHVAEERNQRFGSSTNQDEEDRFSGVKRDFPPLLSTPSNRYTPPARRAPTGQPTVPEAPVDPAIISSSLARQESGSGLAKLSDSSLATTTSRTLTTDQSSFADPNTNESSATEEAKPNIGTGPKGLAQIDAAAANARGSAPEGATSASANMEMNVTQAFKSFAAHERSRVQLDRARQEERKKLTQRKDREMKFNELKSFASTFKLGAPVPHDFLGILAKDKQKQLDILERSQRDIEQLQAAKEASAAGQGGRRASADARGENIAASPGKTNLGVPPNQIQTPKSERQMSSTSQTSANNFRNTLHQFGPKIPPHQRNMGGPPTRDPRLPPTGPAMLMTTQSARRLSGALPGGLNGRALEFRPNPTATSFSPSTERPPSSATQRRPSVVGRPLKRGIFFDKKKPKPASERPQMKDHFNPLNRMKKEAEAEKKIAEAEKRDFKEYSANGGIPQAYRTPPTWAVPAENVDKSYVDMLIVPPRSGTSGPPGSVPLAQQQSMGQFPYANQGMPQAYTPNQAPRLSNTPSFQGREQYLDDQRIHTSSASPSMSMYNTPRIGHQMLVQQPMVAQSPGYAPQMGQFQMGMNGQHISMAQVPAGSHFIPQGRPMGSPMMINNSSTGYMPMQMQQQMPMFAPAGAQFMPGQMMNMPNGGLAPNGYPSPRPPMMAHQGSQQGQVQQYMMMPGQQGPQMFQQGPALQMHQMQMQQMQQMRPGAVPMQQSYSGSPHVQQPYPQGRVQFGNFAPQGMAPPMMQYPHGPPGGPMNQMNGVEEGK